MAAIFPRWTNRIPLAIGVGTPVALSTLVGAVWYWFSPWYTDVGYQPEQPVPFSHKLHAGDLGLDCRYCHSTVEESSYAAIPPTATCMNCHSQVGTERASLAPIRESWETGKPVPWVKVHQLPEYAYFDHSVHLAAGVGCSTCHGRIDRMPVVSLESPLSMQWCLDCHRNPGPNLRPRDQVTNMDWDPATAGYDATQDPTRTRQVSPPIHCSGCHR